MPRTPSPRWDEDLSDPSELSGWRPPAAPPPGPAPTLWGGPAAPPRPNRPARHRPGRHRPAPHRPAPCHRAPGATRRPGPPRLVPPAGAARRRPGNGHSTQVLDRGWQDDAPPEGDHADGFPAPARATARRAEPGPRPQLPYVAGFDGLRALALLAVLAFHHGFEFVRAASWASPAS